jgi:hypothetical protein
MRMIAAASIFFALLAGQLGSAQSGSELVMLGSGMPAADPDRFGPAEERLGTRETPRTRSGSGLEN